ncbi:unnamed protein product [Effrenium voratum]|uniref:Uncharacterized protein n=1 Tax=Effrenium voratum TaxID=2562239 RepID=A0AA36I8X1_9DINO|nr:unnamed protein product [Effrenium voratum]CAJ1448340.1 unnamed protein product [Effrenium voratum]
MPTTVIEPPVPEAEMARSRIPTGLLEALGSRNGSLLTYVRPGSSQAGPGAAKEEPKLQEVGGDGKGPDASRGYDVEEYAKIWHMLQEKTETWPCVQKFSIIGPAGDDFVAQVQEAVSSSLGAEAEKVSTVPKQRWQSVRLDVRCASPDDFCLLHSRLKSLPNARFLL